MSDSDISPAPVSAADWVAVHSLSPVEVDCATAVMLKILDGKCKMQAAEKTVMAALYEAVRTQPGVGLGADIHALIAQAGVAADEAMRNHIYEKRVLAESAISRPVMKAFKAMIRQKGLLDGVRASTEDEV
jgi:hypothetical protein